MRRFFVEKHGYTLAFLNKYVSARKNLCLESKATKITPRKSSCAKELYGAMLKVWNKLTKTSWQTRFALAMPVVSKNVGTMCAKYAMKSRSKSAARKSYIACTTAAVQGHINWLKKKFKKAQLLKIKPHLYFSKTSFTFKQALLFLSAPECSGESYPNQSHLYPRCKQREPGSTYVYSICDDNNSICDDD